MNSNPLLESPKVLSLLLTGLIFLYTFLYPPFLSATRVDIVFRLTTEISVLLILLLTVLLKIHNKTMMLLLMAIMFMFLYWQFSLDESRNILSFFNKIIFFILLLKKCGFLFGSIFQFQQ